jgi:uncharacterized protein (DUF1810 family)
MSHGFDLERFISAQEPVIEQVYRELRAGRKQSHWMWFIFPQLVGLGRSPMAQRYAIGSLVEAQVYLNHPVLGRRLTELTDIVNRVSGRSMLEIFGSPDDMKFHSSMTLFEAAAPGTAPGATPFRAALDKYFSGQTDHATEDGLRSR